MLLRKLWRTMGLYKAQFISMIIMISLGMGIFIGFNMEWVSIEKNTGSFFDDTGFADYRIVSEAGFTKDDLKSIEDMDGADRASRYICVNADVKGRDGDSLALTVTENEDVSGVMVVQGDAYDSKSADGIWLSDSYAGANNIAVGDKLTLEYKNFEIKGEVKGLIKASEHMVCVRDETQIMPDYDTYGYAYISPVFYEKAAGFEYYPQINVISDMDKKAFTDKVDDKLDRTLLILSKDENISYAGADGEIEEGKTMGSVLPVLFLLIAVLTMVTTMHRIAAKEKLQIGTLKALGFKDRRILRHYTSYAFMVGIAGSAAGVALGYFVAYMIMNPDGAMGTYFDMPEWKLYLPWFCYVIPAGIILLLTLIGYLSVKKMLQGTAADALRPYSPKKMRRLLIEKSHIFDRLSFGARWNLRDAMRHKSRMAMSLIGIVGCTLIITATLGMRDTMDDFLKTYYDDATNYSSRIYIAEEATPDERDKLADKYDGDWSSSVSVQIEDKAVSLDIYDTSKDRVRFPADRDGFAELSDDGAYICRRIADEFDLEQGDSIKISPYGSNDEYTVKVAGIIRSVSENIVISPEYADKLDISYVMDSVYTQTPKADIKTDGAIKSVQSKQAIIDSFDSFMEIMNLMIVIFILAAAVLGVVVLYNLGVMSYTERYTEMATLKVTGFRDRKIGRLLAGQNLWISVIGIIIGIPAGAGALSYLMTALAPEYELKIVIGPVTYIVSVLLTFGVSMAVSLMVARKNRHIDMVEALKGAE